MNCEASLLDVPIENGSDFVDNEASYVVGPLSQGSSYGITDSISEITFDSSLGCGLICHNCMKAR